MGEDNGCIPNGPSCRWFFAVFTPKLDMSTSPFGFLCHAERWMSENCFLEIIFRVIKSFLWGGIYWKCVCVINFFFFCSMKCDSLYWKGLILLSYSTRIWRNMYINKQRKNYRLTYDLKYIGYYYSYCYVGTVWETMLRQSTYSKEINGFDWLPWCPTEADLGRRRGGKNPEDVNRTYRHWNGKHIGNWSRFESIVSILHLTWSYFFKGPDILRSPFIL